jgi:ATP-dependent Clp protease ATP-binding subunit ClpX
MDELTDKEPPEGRNESVHARALQEAARAMASRLPLISPRQLYRELEKRGYRGQDKGRRSLCLMAYRHVKRVKALFDDESTPGKLEKLNYLLIGPTGCGKTYIIELLFSEILKIPTVLVDITNYSETGYVGDDVKTVLTRLIYAARGNIHWASCGVICLDEFDKLASGQSNVRFEGQGTSKDVTGFGVQKELLRMLEGGEIVVPLDYGFSQYGAKVKMSCKNISFIASGAFSGYKTLAEQRGSGGKIGFRWTPRQKYREKIAVSYDDEEVNDIETFQVYGFLPELMGRFSRIVIFDALDEETLKDILKSTILDRFIREFATEGLTLLVDDEVLTSIVKESAKRQTGARGLGTILTGYLEDAAYRSFAGYGEREVRLFVEEGKVSVHITPSPEEEEEIRHFGMKQENDGEKKN